MKRVKKSSASLSRANSSSALGLSWWVSVAFVTAFVGFIIYLSQIPLKPLEPVINAQISTPIKNSAPMPELDRFDFYQLLQEQRINSDQSEGHQNAPLPRAGYILQAASFSHKADAERLRATLLLEGFNATTEAVRVKGRLYYRVYVGPFNSKQPLQHAELALRQLKLKPLVVSLAR